MKMWRLCVYACVASSIWLIENVRQFEALRRVHLIPTEGTADESADTINANVFRNLDSPVSEGGENFSTGSVKTTTLHFYLLIML
jgi:hypothetical protein